MAFSHSLIIEIDARSLQGLPAASRVVVTKQGTTGTPNVAWLAWKPTTSTTITWSETYGLYSASTDLSAATALRVTAAVDRAIDRAVYPFRDGRFDAPALDANILPHHYDVHNDSGRAATFGLLQGATIDGTSIRGPVNAAVVPPGFTADFAPLTTLRVWVKRGTTAGSVVTVPQNASILLYDAEDKTVRCRYDGENAFIVVTAETN